MNNSSLSNSNNNNINGNSIEVSIKKLSVLDQKIINFFPFNILRGLIEIKKTLIGIIR